MGKRSKSAVSDKLSSAADSAQAGAREVAGSAQQVVEVAGEALTATAAHAGEAFGAGIEALAVRGRRARKQAKAEAERRRKAAEQQAHRGRKQARTLKKQAKKVNKRAQKRFEQRANALSEAAAELLDRAPDSLALTGRRKPKRRKKRVVLVVVLAAGAAAAAAHARRPAEQIAE